VVSLYTMLLLPIPVTVTPTHPTTFFLNMCLLKSMTAVQQANMETHKSGMPKTRYGFGRRDDAL